MNEMIHNNIMMNMSLIIVIIGYSHNTIIAANHLMVYIKISVDNMNIVTE